ncbi:hypothetical protein [Amycolatopsis methanolica]|uniref:hypothetical protein n=1 Tax=Amycolatopsis methanolica TaxID=1814 RepID=UPI003449E3E1
MEALTGDPLPGIAPTFTSGFLDGRLRFAGSGLPVLAPTWVESPSGLILPAEATRGPAPIDQVEVYTTLEELLGVRVDATTLLFALQRNTFSNVINFCTNWLVLHARIDIDWRTVDELYVAQYFVGPTKIRAEHLVRRGRHLVAPQILLLLIKLAMFYAETSDDEQNLQATPLLPFMLADTLVSDREFEDGDLFIQKDGLPTQFALEIISNHHFNAPLDIAHMTSRFTRRWIEMPTEEKFKQEKPLPDLFSETTGITLDELTSVALTIWAFSQQRNQNIFTLNDFAGAGIEIDRAHAVLKFLSASRSALKDLVMEDHEAFEFRGAEWSFSAFERFPLLAMEDGSFVLLSPRLLINRVFGWLPYWDIASPLRARTESRFKEFDRYFRNLSEAYVLEVLHSMSPPLAGERRIYSEADLYRLIGKRQGVKIVDASIDYGDAWVVLDVSTRQLNRESVAGVSADALVKDYTALAIEKAKQIESTIGLLKRHERELTGHTAKTHRTYIPVVVAAEGFPVNPVMTSLIEAALIDQKLLQGDDITPIQIISGVELEMIESIQENGGPSFAQLLLDKAKGNLGKSSMRDYLLLERRLRATRPKRLDRIFDERFRRVIDLMSGSSSRSGSTEPA